MSSGLVRRAAIDAAMVRLAHPLTPDAPFEGAMVSRMAGLSRLAVNLARLPPGGAAFPAHTHAAEEEWVFVLSGEGRLEIGGESHAMGPGDFAGFAAGGPARRLVNASATAPLTYLVGGQADLAADVVEVPGLGKTGAVAGGAVRFFDSDTALRIDALRVAGDGE